MKIKSIFFTVLFSIIFNNFYVLAASTAATLTLSPQSQTVAPNATFTVNINLNTGGSNIDGVDIFYLRFNPAILNVVDSNASLLGIQIAPGSLMNVTTANSANNTNGTILFSQTAIGGTTFNGSGTLATITFRAVNTGTSTLNFDFTLGSTSDTNVASKGVDVLHSVTNGMYIVSGSPISIPTPTPISTSPITPPAIGRLPKPSDYSLREGDIVGSAQSDDPDIYIVNEFGFKRLFLNPIIFNFYGHLGGYSKVKKIIPQTRDVFITSGLFRNCETNDPKVYAVEITGEDTGALHHVNMSGTQAVSEDPDFFKRIFCINNNEFNWYIKSTPYNTLSALPIYTRR